MSLIQTYAHPFKQGVMNIIEKHFASEIAGRFKLSFEAETFNPKASVHVWRQVKDNNLVMEVYYNTGSTLEYVCDLYSWESKPRTEAHLLRMITDRVKDGKFGSNWLEDSTGRISEIVTSGKLETPDDPLLVKGGEDL